MASAFGSGRELSRTKLIAMVSLAITIITMITSIQLPLYASSTTEDDGWVEGDYEGSPEEQEEQAQEDWEDCVDVSTEYKDFCNKNPK